MTLGKLIVERNVINDSPDYQRESGVWSPEKQQLFLDSIFNDFDVPKVYFHDLTDEKSKYDYAVIDGKQRLHAIWDFADGKTALADDFALRDTTRRASPPKGARFQELTKEWQEILKAKSLDVVVIKSAGVDDIEDLFSRLNNGEPLNAAEKRNSIPGEMNVLVRKLAKSPFFTEKLPFDNKRFQHLELAAKILLIEKTQQSGGEAFCDLKKKFLDKMVRDGKALSPAVADKLIKNAESGLAQLGRVFSDSDPLLAKQAALPVYYLFVNLMSKEYASKDLFAEMSKFLNNFQQLRTLDLQKPEEERDPFLSEFGRLMQQGTNDLNSLRTRVSILRRYFLEHYPDTPLKDKKREFSPEERQALYFLSNKKCQNCEREFKDISEMEADHKTQWAHGGPTSLKNGRALCSNCNKASAKKVTSAKK
jgi:hypothetical protein